MERLGRGAPITFALVLLGALALAALASRTPEPLPANAPADRVSAGRAAQDIAVLARVPHPVGSPQDAAVRDGIVARLRELSLATEILKTVQAYPFRSRPGGTPRTIYNVVARVAGRDPAAPALLIMSHYDSVPSSPGAADDMAGVASALEIARLLKATPPFRDVLFAFTDGEEAGLVGAGALFADPVFRRRVGFVVNMDTRGGGGRAMMYQTGPDERGAEALFADHPSGPSSNSLAAFVYRIMPNDTDLSVALARGLPGLNYAFIGRPELYHTPIATPQSVEAGAVQSLAQQVWAVVQPMAYGARLPGPGPELTWFDLFGAWVIAYPTAVGWTPVGLSLLLLSVAIRNLRHRATAVGRGLLLGAVQSLGATILAALALQLYAALTLHGYYHSLAHARRTEFVTIGVALMASLIAFRPLRTADPLARWAGATTLASAISLLLQLAAPQTAFIAEWPTLLTALAIAAASARAPAFKALTAGCAFVSLGFLFEFWHEIILGIGVIQPAVGAALLPLALGAAAPLLMWEQKNFRSEALRRKV